MLEKNQREMKDMQKTYEQRLAEAQASVAVGKKTYEQRLAKGRASAG